jgi:hypothetical protein
MKHRRYRWSAWVCVVWGGAAIACEPPELVFEEPSNVSPADYLLVAGGETVVSAVPYRLSGGHLRIHRRINGDWLVLRNWRRGMNEPRPGFASAIALSGGVLLVGDSLVNNSYYGSVQVHRFDGTWWNHETTLWPPTGRAGDQFGRAVAVDGDVIAVASIERDAQLHSVGVVHVFRFHGVSWTHEAALRPPESFPGASFGAALAVSGDRIVVAAPYTAGTGFDGLFVFSFDGVAWRGPSYPLTGLPESSPGLGGRVRLSGDRLVVANTGSAGSGFGSFHAYQWDGEIFRYQPAQSTCGRNLSAAYVDFTDALLVAGAGAGGTVYRKDESSWRPLQVLHPDRSGATWGALAATESGYAVVEGSDRARLLHFSFCEPDCNRNGESDVEETLVGTSRDCNGNCTPDDCEEQGPPGSFPDCNGNGRLDACDLQAGHSPDCNGNGKPDECEVPPLCPTCADCNGNGVPDACDRVGNDCDRNNRPDECDVPPLCPSCVDCNGNGIPDGCDRVGNDCDRNGRPDECDVPPLCPQCRDCNDNGLPDRCDATSGRSPDCNGNLMPDECEVPPRCPHCADCNANGIPDECDARSHGYTDCNRNLVPDECELPLVLPGSTDCNGNGLPDNCEIANGLVEDCTRNGFPDECEADCDGDGRADVCATLSMLLPAAPRPYQFFGAALALEDGKLIVGSPDVTDFTNQGQGSVYIFEQVGRTWVERAKLVAPGGHNRDEFGKSVAVQGERLYVGAPRFGGSDRGAVFAYRRTKSGWTIDQTLTLPPSPPYTGFGGIVRVDGDFLAALARGSGSRWTAHVFRWKAQQWTKMDTLDIRLRYGAALYEASIHSVALSGGVVAIRAVHSSYPGMVLLYDCTAEACRLLQELQSPMPDMHSQFGFGLDLRDGTLVAGDPSTRAVYLYSRVGDQWMPAGQFSPEPAALNPSSFGTLVRFVSPEIVLAVGDTSRREPVTFLFRRTGES